MNYQITFFADLFSEVMLLLLLVSIISSRQYKYNSTKALIVSMALTFAAIAFDAVNYFCEGKPDFDTLHIWALSLTLCLINFIEAFVGIYINCYVNEHKKPGTHFTYRFSVITAIVEGCCLLLTIILISTGKVFIIQDHSQSSGPLYIIPFALDAVASIFMIGYLLSHVKFISIRDTCVILTVVVFTAAGYLLDGFIQGFNFSIMFGLVAIMLNYLLVKDREVRDLRNEDENRFRKRVQAVLAISDNFEIIFLVNLDNGKYKVDRTLSDHQTFSEEKFEGQEHFIERNKEFILSKVHPDDREKLLKTLDIPFLNERFSSAPKYTVNYRLLSKGKEVWYKMRIKPERSWPARHKVMIGIFNNDAEYRTEKKHEMELEKQLSRYTLVHNIIGSGSWSFYFDTQKNIYDWHYSDEIIRMLGYKPPATDDFTWESLMHPDDVDIVRDAIHAAISDASGQTVFDVENRMRSRDGVYHWYHSSGRILLNEDGSGELLGTHINTDAVHDKNELEYHRDQNYKFMQFRSDIFNYIATQDSDPEKFFNYFADKLMPNAECDEIIYRKNDGYIMRRSLPSVSVPSDDICNNCPLMAHISKNSQTKNFYCIEDRDSCPDGLELPAECPVKSLQGRIIYSNGVPKGYLALHFIKAKKRFNEGEQQANIELANLLGLGFDRIKAREEQQIDYERYRMVHDIVHSGMWFYRFNKNGEIYQTSFSDEFLSIIGWNRKDSYESMDFLKEIIHPDDYENTQKAFYVTLHDKSCKATYDAEYRMRNQKGEYHWFHTVGRVIRYQNGYGEFFGTHINIDSEKKREELQAAIERARDNAEAASAAKSTFLFNMSHDIRTPLNAIVGFTEMALTHKAEQDKVEEYLNKVKSSNDYLLTIVNDVLDLSRIESGKTEIEEKIYSIEEVAGHVSEINSLAAKAKNITFIHSLENCTEPYVFCDAIHIKQIVVNILNNAIKYTPAGGTIWHTVREELSDTPGEVIVHITIKDNGIGMDQKFVSHIFEAFERAKNTTQSGIQGTGLGMSIVKRLTDLLGGTIDIETAPGKGTTVSVSFTHKIATAEQIEEYKAQLKQKEEAELKIDEEKLVGKRLLLVEDNELNREISEQILQERGLIIETAVDGKDALDQVKEKGANYYDFILMDIQMPVMDGYESTREIRKLPDAEKLPIAAFSANAFEEDRKRSIEAGMNIHVAKPINIKELTRSLASLL